MFVSRKYLALIHFIAREVATWLHVAEPAHESIKRDAPTSTSRVLLEPLPKSCIQGLALGLGHKPGLFDQGFIRAQSDVLHTIRVYTCFVYTASRSIQTLEFAL